MNKQIVKKIFVILLIISCILILSPKVFAANSAFNFSDFENVSNADIDEVAKNTMGSAIQVIRIVATGMSVIMLSYIGIKYMMASPAEKAEFKKTATIFAVGAIMIFAAGNILSIIVEFTEANISIAK